MSDLKAGSLVYRVVEHDPPDDNAQHTWKVACVTVEHASKRQIKLRTLFPGSFRRLFKTDALDRVFFETPLRAIQHFLISQRSEIEALDRRRKDAERAVAWAASQEGMSA